jgi:hypothetical protein
MTCNRPARRALVLASGGVLAATLAWFPAGSAQAVGGSGALTLSASVDHAGTCSVVGKPPDQPTALVNGRASDTLNLNATVSDPGDIGDVSTVTGSIASSGSVQLGSGSLATFKGASSGHVTLTRAQGAASSCNADGTLTSDLSFLAPAATRGWLYVSRDQTGTHQITMVTVVDTVHGSTQLFMIFGGSALHTTDRTFLVPGSYRADLRTTYYSGPITISKAATSSTTLSGRFVKAGAALGRAKGTGTPYVALPGATSCSAHTATLGWTGKAGQVKSASVLVNGSKQASVTNPKARSSLVLKKLSATADLTVTARLVMKDGSRTTATRSYVPCRG